MKELLNFLDDRNGRSRKFNLYGNKVRIAATKRQEVRKIPGSKSKPIWGLNIMFYQMPVEEEKQHMGNIIECVKGHKRCSFLEVGLKAKTQRSQHMLDLGFNLTEKRGRLTYRIDFN